MKRVRVKAENKGKKLSLNPKTVRVLNEEDLKLVTGGMSGDGSGTTKAVDGGTTCTG
ncbi:MAG: hypothetical protein JWM53_909 [bacterium]|nr:hypothetical protein [bacterium]